MKALVAGLLAATQVGCSFALGPRPPPGRDRCEAIGSVALPLLDGVFAVGAISYGALRTFDPVCGPLTRCDNDWSALTFGLLVAAPFAISSVLGFIWREDCKGREPKAVIEDEP